MYLFFTILLKLIPLYLMLSPIADYGCLNYFTSNFLAQISRYLKHLINSFPLLVNEYSTLGGISLNLFFETNSNFSNSFNRFDKVLGLIFSISLIKSLNLFVPSLCNSLSINKAHFLLRWFNIFVTGHIFSICST